MNPELTLMFIRKYELPEDWISDDVLEWLENDKESPVSSSINDDYSSIRVVKVNG